MTNSELTAYLYGAVAGQVASDSLAAGVTDGNVGTLTLPPRVAKARSELGETLFAYWVMRGAEDLIEIAPPPSWAEWMAQPLPDTGV